MQLVKLMSLVGVFYAFSLPTYATSPSEKEEDPREGAKYESSISGAHFSCSINEKTDKTYGSKIASNIGGWSKKWSIPAARKALDAGYNYAIMAPYMVVPEGRFAPVRNFWGTRIGTHGYNAYYRSLSCFAVDDIAAFEILSGGDTKFEPGRHMALVDLRQFIETLGGQSGPTKVWTPNISAQRFKLPGDKERIERIYPLQRQAAQCYTSLRPTSFRQFQYDATPQEKTNTQSCLEALIPAAKQAGWDDFFLLKDIKKASTASTGYSVNTPSVKAIKSAPSIAAKRADETIWGRGWLDQSQNFPSLSGIFLTESRLADDPSVDTEIILASNTMDESELLDYAVYFVAKRRLREKKEGIVIQDLKAQNWERFNQRRADSGNKTVPTKSKDTKKLERKIKYLEQDIVRYKRKIRQAEESEKTVKDYLKNAPAQSLPANDSFKLTKQTYLAKLSQLTKERDSLLAQSNALNANGNLATVPLSTNRVSSTAGPKYRAIFRAFEDYQNVIYVKGGGVPYKCKRKYYVCADKMQAYNAIGPRISAPGHSQLSMPSGYEIFDVTPVD